MLKQSWFDTPLGPILAIADADALVLLEFEGCRNFEREIEQLRLKTQSDIITGTNKPIISIEKELMAYFKGKLMSFYTPIRLMGTPFQQQVWGALMKIPYGETRSYGEQASAIGKPSACRAVANANGANQLAIVIPCHRIIQSNGTLGGYGGGIARKQWLIDHEKNAITAAF